MALLALIAGITERARPASAATATPSSFSWGKGVSQVVGSALTKIDKTFLKLDSSFLKLDKSFLKLDDAFLKLEPKIDSTFLKLNDANANFLKINDANAKFLKIDGTAANAGKLGGMTPDAFVQGRGGVVSGATTIGLTASTPKSLLATPDGKLSFSVLCNADGLRVIVTNNTGVTLDAVQQLTEGTSPTPTASASTLTVTSPTFGPTTPISLNATMANQLHLQFFPGTGFPEALTLILSAEPTADQNNVEVVGQLLIGSL